MAMRERQPEKARQRWTLFTNHGGVLLYVAKYPGTTVAEAAGAMKLSPRTVLRILADLSAAGFITIEKSGRQNLYSVSPHSELRRPEMRGVKVARLLNMFQPAAGLDLASKTLPALLMLGVALQQS